MKALIFSIVLFLTLLPGRLLANETDSLLNLLNTELPDTTRIDVLGQLSRSVLGADPDRAISYSLEAVDLARQINDLARAGYAYKNIGLGHYYKGDFVLVLEFWEASLSAYQEINDAKGTSNLLSNIGAVYYSTGDNSKAIEYYLKALRIAEASGDHLREATVLQNIGAVYESTEELDKAESYLLQAYEICQSINYEKGLGMSSLNLGEIYFQQQLFDKAGYFFQEARKHFEKTNDGFLPNAITMIGRMQTQQGKYREAAQSLSEAYAMADELGGKLAMAGALDAQGALYLQTGEIDKAITVYNSAVAISKSIGANENLREGYIGLIQAYRSNRNYPNAVAYQDSLLEINKLIYDLEKNQKLENMQLSFDIEKKETEIDILNADNEIKSREIAQANLVKNFFITMAVLFLLIIAGIAYQYRYVRRTNQIITKERNKSDQLLRNILPLETAEELKTNGSVKARKYEDATVLFTDFVDFTGQARDIKPEDLVKTVNFYFSKFDDIVLSYGLEKIKTIGDAYMCAGGIPQTNEHHTHDAVMAAMDMLRFVEQTLAKPPEGIRPFKIRIGLNSGPLVAGVVGLSKFQYDIWGDTVNIAARVETSSMANQINVSENVYNKLKDKLDFEYRGEIAVKNRGKLKMYFLDRTAVLSQNQPSPAIFSE